MHLKTKKHKHINTLTHQHLTFKTEMTERIYIKLLCNWMTSKDLTDLWSKMSQDNKGKWNNIQTTLCDKQANFWIIINRPQAESYYDAKRTIVMIMEPHIENNSFWNNWYDKQSDFLLFMNLQHFKNNSEWHLNLTYQELMSSEFSLSKQKIFSTVTSSQYSMDGHKQRVDFIKLMNQENLPDDHFGRTNLFNFANHRGQLFEYNKNQGLVPYLFSFAGENCTDLTCYYTEKLIDCILAECVCFYSGPDVSKYMLADCVIELDLSTKEKQIQSKSTVLKHLNLNLQTYNSKISAIKIAKQKILTFDQFFPRMWRLLNVLQTCFVLKLNYYDETREFLSQHSAFLNICKSVSNNQIKNLIILTNVTNSGLSLHNNLNLLEILGVCFETLQFQDVLICNTSQLNCANPYAKIETESCSIEHFISQSENCFILINSETFQTQLQNQDDFSKNHVLNFDLIYDLCISCQQFLNFKTIN